MASAVSGTSFVDKLLPVQIDLSIDTTNVYKGEKCINQCIQTIIEDRNCSQEFNVAIFVQPGEQCT